MTFVKDTKIKFPYLVFKCINLYIATAGVNKSFKLRYELSSTC